MTKAKDATQAGSSAQVEAKAASKARVMLETYDLTDYRIPSLNGKFSQGRHTIRLGMLKQRRHVDALPVVGLLEALGITDPEALAGTIKVDKEGNASRLYGFEVVRSKDGSQILLQAGDQSVPLQQSGDKLTCDKLQNGTISFQMKERQDKTTYQTARVTLTTKGNPANYVILLSLDSEVKDEEGNLLDPGGLLQSDFAQGNYETLIELLSPPKDPVIMMHELPTGAYKVLSVAEPVLREGKKDGKPWSLNSYAITIEMPDGSSAVTYADGQVRDHLNKLHESLKKSLYEYDPEDVLDLANTPYWLDLRSVTVKNPEEVERGEPPRYRIVAFLTDEYPMQFNTADTAE